MEIDKHTPKWALKEEREYEAGNPGPNHRINGKQPPPPMKKEKRAPEKEMSGGEMKYRRTEVLEVGPKHRMIGKQPPASARKEKGTRRR